MSRKISLPVTVIIPVLNEEKHLPDCLQSLGDNFERVVVVDSGSEDATCRIAEQAGARVVHFEWNGRYPKKRNWALENIEINTEWVLFLDADERVTGAFVDELKQVLPSAVYNGYRVSFDNKYMGCLLKFGDVFTKLNLFKYGSGKYEYIPEESWSKYDMEVHEHPIVDGRVGSIKSRLKHCGPDDPKAADEKHKAYAEWEVNRYRWYKTSGAAEKQRWTFRQKVKYGLMATGLLGPLYLLYSYVGKCGFLDGVAGWRFAMIKYRYFCAIHVRLKHTEQKQV